MGNPWKGDVPFGPKHTLRLNFNAVCEAEDDLGESLMGLLMQNRMGFKTVRTIAHRGLLTLQPDVTVSDVGDIIQDIGFAAALKIVVDVLKREIIGEGAEGNAPPAKAKK